MRKLFIAGLGLLISTVCGAEKISFSDQIRPLLNRNCTGCHGGVKQAGGFSLLYKERAFGKTHHGIGIVPGKPEESMLYKLITSPPEVYDDHKQKHRRLEHMPMEKEPLSKEEIALIKTWIEQGAHWEEHWAYNPPEKQELPKTNSNWPANRIDFFTLNKMAEFKLVPSDEEKKETLLRRVSLDLTGLPPSVEDLKEFVNDKSTNAYEKAVDKMLANPAYGEKMASMWMDLARYSDTQGYEKDSNRTIYRFRDEIIKAFNKDTPYDQFVVEQMAGDLLPNATEHQKILTAFHRNTMTNTEGGTNDEEFRVAAVIDRVNTTWEAFLGTSYGCVQCHTHPYDPFTHAEYYQFMAFLNNTADADRNDESPFIKTPDIYQQKQLDEWQQKIDDLKKKLDLDRNEISKNFVANFNKLKTEIEPPKITNLKNIKTASKSGHKINVNENGTFSSEKNDKNKAVFTISGKSDLQQLNFLKIEVLPDGGYGHAGNFVLSNLSAKIVKDGAFAGQFVRVRHKAKGILSLAEVQVMSGGKNIALNKQAKQSSTGWEGVANRAVDGKTDGRFDQNSVTHTSGNDTPWWEVDLDKNEPVESIVIHNRAEAPERLDGVIVELLNSDKKVVWSQTIGKSKAANNLGLKEFVIDFKTASATYEQGGFPVKDSLNNDKEKGWAVAGAKGGIQSATFTTAGPIQISPEDEIEITLSFQSKHHQHIFKNFAIKTGFGNADADTMELIGLLNKNSSELSQDEKNKTVDYLLKKSPSGKILAQLNDFQKKKDSLKVATTPIMQELPNNQRRKTKIFIRGNWEDLAEEVSEGTPEVMNKFKPEWPKNRLGMAYWMTSAENPLFARVAVNRFWEQLFGLGIVETLEDFGSQGIKPTHPKLLDDLAYRFSNEHKWSIKSLLKEIVMSATYRQSSNATKEALEKDPFNHYLARGPRFRLSSEQIRDQALKVSGLLSEKMYGPSVMPFQPDGVWMTVYNGQQWVMGKNGEQHRRALYTFWKRTSPYPSMEAFDTPSREVCKVRRIRTNTPLQALVTLNDPVYMECATEFGKLIKNQSGDLDSKLTFAFEKAICRKPKAVELVTLKKLIEELKRDYSKSEEESWTLVANVIMNLDEFLIKR